MFIGPPADAIERMGSKIAARELMQRAGVPVVPGATPADQSDEGVAAPRRSIGFPVLVKASAGGGGKGMRVVRSAGEAIDAIAAARREAKAAFGDGTLYVERLIERPAARRDPGLRRSPRQRRPPVRARVLAAAPAPEGHRGEPVAGADAGAARAHGRRRRRGRARRRLPQRRHHRVPARRRAATPRGSTFSR